MSREREAHSFIPAGGGMGGALQTAVAPGTMRQRAWPEREEKSPFITLNQAGQLKKCTQQQQHMSQQKRANTHI